MTFNPVIPFPLLIPLAVLVVAGGAWLAWRSNARTSGRLRVGLTILRALALSAFALILCNPGNWQPLADTARKVWAVVVDSSASMQTPDGTDGSRWQSAVNIADEINTIAEKRDADVEFAVFDRTLVPQESFDQLSAQQSDGDGSDLVTACGDLISRISARGDELGGVIALTDGRQTVRTDPAGVALRARAEGIPVHGVLIGGDWEQSDLEISSPRRLVVAFSGQKVQLSALVQNHGLGNIRATVELVDAEGRVVDTTNAILGNDASQVISFTIEAPENSTEFTIRAPKMEGERVDSNNAETVRVSLIDTKTRIFIAEGAPYWDSKFLAQLLRQQPHITVNSVYRISDERYFRIDSGDAGPTESSADVFPNTADELGAYDVIILGKGAEHFLTSERIALLREFVSQKGGAVLFSRGKAYAGKWEALEPLEPVLWGGNTGGEMHFEPSRDGEVAGLFGQALPGSGDAIWESLPTLKDARQVDSIKPFTRVLAYGTTNAGGGSGGKVPLLLVRRYGQGAVGLVNADGLWKWDFFPEARELGNMYLEFWSQLTQWLVSYAEFLPGEDYALNLSATKVESGTPINLRAGYRGPEENAPTTMQARATRSGGEAQTIGLGTALDTTGRTIWRGSFEPTTAGFWMVQLVDAEGQAVGPEVALSVTSPPDEFTEVAADPEFLARLTSATGGRLLTASEATSVIDELMKPMEAGSRDAGSIWNPLWARWWVPILLMIPLAGEWWLRRRNGLL